MKKERKKRLRRLSMRQEKRHSEKSDILEGVIHIAGGGFGFVTPDGAKSRDKNTDVFIPTRYINGAMDGDRVKVAILLPFGGRDEGKKGPSGRVMAVIERAHETAICEILPGNIAHPLNPRLPDEIILTGNRRGAKKGDWVTLEITSDLDNQYVGRVINNLGKAGSIKADLDAIMAEYKLPGPYSEADNLQSGTLEPREIERENATKRFTVTIDPVDAKDFDDALSIVEGKEPGTIELGVHISDVAAYLEPNGKFDKLANRHGFSCYLPGRTLPMLPPLLTKNISLAVGKKTLAHSVYFVIDEATGKIRNYRRVHSVIKVDYRLNYDEVQKFIDTEVAPEEWSDELKNFVKKLVDITTKLRKNRAATEEFIELPLPEIRLMCDEGADMISDLVVKYPRISETLVEECMLAANSAVGTELAGKAVAGIYRVHPEPDVAKALEFSQEIEQNFGVRPGDITNRKNCIKFINSLPDSPQKNIILNLLLRSLPRAGYAEKGLIHFALGKNHYCHFTSPIRRYSDLTMHQQLWNLDRNVRTRSASTLAGIAEKLSGCEEVYDAAYFAACDRLKLRYLQQLMDSGNARIFEGVITKTFLSGYQVEIQDFGIFGYIRKADAQFNKFRQKGRELRIGDFVCLRPIRIDFVKGQALFAPAGR